MRYWSLNVSIRLTAACLFLALPLFAQTATHNITDVFITQSNEQIVVMTALEFKGYSDDYVRVYRGDIEKGFDLLEVDNVRNFRGPPGMIIKMKNGEALKMGYPGRVTPSLGSEILTPIAITPENLEKFSSAQYRVKPFDVLNCRSLL